MNPHSSQSPEQAGVCLDALLEAARNAPLPAAADRLALGFGARVEAHLRSSITEAKLTETVLWRWLAGLAGATILITAAAGWGGITANNQSSPAIAEASTFQSDWARYTAAPEVWPSP